MTARIVGAVAFIALFQCVTGVRLSAQTVGSLELGGSVVEYDGFLRSGAAVVAPAVQYDGDRVSAGAQASWVLFESGNDILQFTAAGAWLTPPAGRWRAEFSGSIGAGKYAESDSYGHLLARTRVHYSGDRSGVWFGAGTGQSFAEGSATPVEFSFGTWGVQDRVALAAAVTATDISGVGYVDLVGAVRWTAGIAQLDFQAGLRPVSEVGGEGVYGEAAALFAFNERIALTLSAGRYQSDPARGVLSAKYLNVGVRLNLSGARAREIPTVNRALLRAANALRGSEFASPASIEVRETSSGFVLRVRGRAQTMEIMGTFTDWQPVAMTRLDESTWEVAVSLPAGLHRLNVRIDGGDWLVPTGVRLVETEFGGSVGIVVIP